jgi:DNA-binding PadR family transcriptional regulator
MMARPNRNNPLALAVLMCLAEAPMHPYEIASTLRRRHKDESVKLNYGSLYSVVCALARRRLIVADGTRREGRLPERTVYRLTDAGRLEAHEWLTGLLSVPVKEYPAFEAALSFLPGVSPDEAVALLEERAERLETALAHARVVRERLQERGLPRLLWVEVEFEDALRAAELGFVRRLLEDVSSRSLGGYEWWRSIHEDGGETVAPPFEDAESMAGSALRSVA